MRRILFIMAICLLSVLAGCKKFLEHPPDDRSQLNTPEKVAQLLGTAYPRANYIPFTESISDNVADKGAGLLANTNIDPFFYRDITDDRQDSPEFYWNACYAAIAVCNQALAACASAPDPQNYTAQKGEALIARAYTHFMLVTLFARVFDPVTAGEDPGIPYVTDPEDVVFSNYDRKSVSYVYEMIEKDLVEGLPLINDKQYEVPRYHFTRAAAHAFAARFYLFRKDYEKVIEHANAVFPGNNVSASLRPWNTTYMGITYNELFARYAKSTEQANLLLAETSSLWARSYYLLRYGMDANIRSTVYNNNVTGGTWAFNYQMYTSGANNYLLPKFKEFFVRSSVNANTGLPYVIVPLLTAEEVLFNRAEAFTELARYDQALQDLNTYASTRIRNYNALSHVINADKITAFYGSYDKREGLVRTLLDFKRAEYMQEGMRWFDILRHKLPVVHTTVEGDTDSLASDDLRRVFQLPESVKLSGIPLNPR